MSEEQKQPEIAGSPAAPAEDLQVPTEPDSVTGEAVSERGASARQVGAAAQPTLGTLEAPSETAKGAIAQAAETGPAPSDVPVTNDRELEAWNEQVRRRMRQKSRRSFLGWGVGVVASLGAFRWLTTRREIDGVPWPFRKTLEVNEELARDYFSPERLSPTFAPDRVSADRVNGDLGLDEDVNVAVWKLRVEGLASEDGPLILGLNAIRQLPRLEMIAQFKCIEGWSVVVRWAGTRFSDFMKAYLPRTRSGGPFSLKNPEDLPPYVSMTTPDGGYYVGLEYGEHAASTDAALLRAQRRTPLPGTRRAPAAGDPGEVWREEHQAHRNDPVLHATPGGLLGRRGYDWYVGL